MSEAELMEQQFVNDVREALDRFREGDFEESLAALNSAEIIAEQKSKHERIRKQQKEQAA